MNDPNRDIRHRELRHLLEIVARCNEPVPAWQFAQSMRCDLERGHSGECTNKAARRGGTTNVAVQA